MRALLCLALAFLIGCTYMPEPQPPRTVCNGSIVASSSVAFMSSACQQIPADRCYDDDSEECAAEAERRREYNAGVHRNRVITAVVTIVGIVGLLVYASASN